VSGKEDLFIELKRLLLDEGARKEVGERAINFFRSIRGQQEECLRRFGPSWIKCGMQIAECGIELQV